MRFTGHRTCRVSEDMKLQTVVLIKTAGSFLLSSRDIFLT